MPCPLMPGDILSCEVDALLEGPKPQNNKTLTTHTPLIKGHPLNQGGGLSETTCFLVFLELRPVN